MAHAYKCFQGSKRLNPKADLPFLIIVAQQDHGNAFSEHYIFTGLESLPFLRSSRGYEPDRNVTKEDFELRVTFDAILAMELEHAKAHLENSVFELDQNVHLKVFWEGQNFEYRPIDDKGFTQLAMDKKNKKIITEMFEATGSEALEELKRAWKILSRIEVKAN